MSVLVYTESENGSFKKTAFEVVSYAKAIATELGTTLTAVSINASNTSQLEILHLHMLASRSLQGYHLLFLALYLRHILLAGKYYLR